MNDGVCRVFRPDRFRFFRVEGHRHHQRVFAVVLPMAHGIPDKLARAGPGKIANVLCLEHPCRSRVGAFPLILRSFFRRHDENGSLCRFRLLQTLPLLRRQHFGRVLQHAGGRYDVIGGHCNLDLVVAELQRKLTTTEERFMLPASIVGIGRQAREPLREEKQVGVVFGEILIPAARRYPHLVHDIEFPVYRETGGLPAAQCLRQIDSHHRVDDRVL